METTQIKQSRNGKKPVAFDSKVNVAINGQEVTVKGPKGEIKRTFRPEVSIEAKDGQINVVPASGYGKAATQFQGLTRAIISNMVQGVSNGYEISLDFRGVGYRAEFKGGVLKMTVGMSHTPMVKIPEGVGVKIEQIDEGGLKFPRVKLDSVDKELVGRVAAYIRTQRPPEPYNGKGVRYTGEKIREKAGKTGKAG